MLKNIRTGPQPSRAVASSSSRGMVFTARCLDQVGRITGEACYSWSEKAREKKKKCDRESITLEEFQQWLAES